MKTRIISGIGILTVLTLTVIFFDTVFSDALILAAYLISLKEIRNAFSENNTNIGFAFLGVIGTYYIMSKYLSDFGMVPAVILLVSYAFVTVFEFDRIDVKQVSSSYMYGIYSLAGFYSLSLFRVFLPYLEFGHDSAFLFVFCILNVWIGDACAYFTGYFLGKHKMTPKLSPKKTVEGAIGGLFFAGVGAVLMVFVYKLIKQMIYGEVYTLSSKAIMLWFVMGIVEYAFGMVGDLFCSAIKRQVGIKDYSNLIPGHGGILDRFDSVIVVSPAIALMAWYFGLNGGIFNV